MMQDIRAELKEMLDESEWEWLIPHARREAIVVVTPNLDLVDVGVAIAGDNVESVQRWISEALIYKPSQEELTDWNGNQKKRFNTLIVQPYVLIQELAA
ncbi:MAG TPA: DUF2288 domain-containing protein [Halomicronema sp.]